MNPERGNQQHRKMLHATTNTTRPSIQCFTLRAYETSAIKFTFREYHCRQYDSITALNIAISTKDPQNSVKSTQL